MEAAGLDVYKTPRNLEFLSYIASNRKNVRDYLKSVYGGEWVEYGADNKMHLVIALTRPIHMDSSIFLDEYYKFAYVTFAYDELELVKNRIVDYFFMGRSGVADALMHLVEIDVKKNRVAVHVTSANVGKAYEELVRLGFDLNMIDVRVRDALHQPALN